MTKSASATVSKKQTLLPATWPGAFGLYKYSSSVVKLNWKPLLGMFILLFIASIVVNVPSENEIFITLSAMIIDAAFSVIVFSLLLRSTLGQKVDATNWLDDFTILKAFYYLIYSILLFIVMALSFLALIVPFFFIVPRLLLSDYFIVEKGQDPIEAMKSSWDLTKGHVGKVYGVLGVGLLFGLLFITIIGIPVALYLLFMYSASMALLYRHLLKPRATKAKASAAASPLN